VRSLRGEEYSIIISYKQIVLYLLTKKKIMYRNKSRHAKTIWVFLILIHNVSLNDS